MPSGPSPRANESVAIDIHSHGEIAAYFSGQDRNDMGSNVVLACAVGLLNDPFPTISLSLFASGVEIPISVPQEVTVNSRVAMRIGQRVFEQPEGCVS